MLVAYDESLTRHLAGAPHIEQPDRVREVAAELERRGLLDERIDTRRATEAEIALAHDAGYIELAKRESERLDVGEYNELTTGDTDIDAASYEGALHAAGGALTALAHVTGLETCARLRSCRYNARSSRRTSAARHGLSIQPLQQRGDRCCACSTAETGEPAIIADIDYHHGNGTQALVGNGLSYLSTHAMPAYPGTGSARDQPHRNRRVRR